MNTCISQKQNAKRHETNQLGTTELSAICLSDDEYESQKENKLCYQIGEVLEQYTGYQIWDSNVARCLQMPNLRYYKIRFEGPSYGMSLISFQGRFIIKDTKGESEKPSSGDILISINSNYLTHGLDHKIVIIALKEAMQRPPVEMLFGEDEQFSSFFQKKMNEEQRWNRKSDMKQTAQKPDVIEILDD